MMKRDPDEVMEDAWADDGPDYVVLRDPEYPQISGVWYDRARLLRDAKMRRMVDGVRGILPSPDAPAGVVEITFTPTPFIETRDDGAVAQVWMRLPPTP